MQKPRIDLAKLERKARESPERESFEVIEQIKFARIRGGARIAGSDKPVYILEITIFPCPSGSSVDSSVLESQWRLVKDPEMGYNLSCQDGGFIEGEDQLDPGDFASGLEALRMAVMNRFGTRGGD